jgi:hypothetical protein
MAVVGAFDKVTRDAVLVVPTPVIRSITIVNIIHGWDCIDIFGAAGVKNIGRIIIISWIYKIPASSVWIWVRI